MTGHLDGLDNLSWQVYIVLYLDLSSVGQERIDRFAGISSVCLCVFGPVLWFFGIYAIWLVSVLMSVSVLRFDMRVSVWSLCSVSLISVSVLFLRSCCGVLTVGQLLARMLGVAVGAASLARLRFS